MLKHKHLLLLCLIVLVSFSGCGKKDSSSTKMIYGNELYNASYIYMGGEVLHIIPLMSKKDISKAEDVQVTSSDGKYKVSYEIEDGGYDLKGYHLYRVCLHFSDLEFSGNSLDIKSIRLLFAGDEKYDLDLDKCRIVKSTGEYDSSITFNGTPLKMPATTQSLSVEMSAEKKITVTDIYLTNDDMIITEYPDENGGYTDKFTEFDLSDDGSIYSWFVRFSVKKDQVSEYKNYGTSIVIRYRCDGKNYFTLPVVTRTIYNPFDSGCESIEKYFEYLGI